MSPEDKKRKKTIPRPENTLLFFPGLAADVDMYLPLIRELTRRRFPIRMEHVFNGPMTHSEETLEDYSLRMIEEHGLKDRHFKCVIASSMGGMLAQIALKRGWIQTDQLILISTAFSGDDLQFYSIWGAHLLRYVPSFLHKTIRNIMGFAYPILRFNNQWSRILGIMIRRNDASLLFTAPYMIRNWRRGKPSPILRKEDIPVYQFHGTMDQLISYSKIKRKRNIEYTDRFGSHLTFIYRASEIASVIESRCGDIVKKSK